MRIPNSLASLADQGIIEEVVRPLMSGKEAEVFLVLSGGELRVAKVYKDAQNRTFKHRAEYTEGRKTRNTRDQRALSPCQPTTAPMIEPSTQLVMVVTVSSPIVHGRAARSRSLTSEGKLLIE